MYMEKSVAKPKNDFEELKLVNWLFIVVRLVGITVIFFTLLVLIHSDLLYYNPAPIIFVLTPLFLITNVVWWLTSKNKNILEKSLEIQPPVDALLIAVVIYFTGAGHSALQVLVLVPIFSAAMVSKKSVILTLLVAVLSLLFMAFGELYGFLLPPGLFIEKEGLYKGIENFFKPSWIAATSILVAFQGFYLISKIKKRDLELARVKDEFFFRAVHDLRAPLTALRWLTEKYQMLASKDRDVNFSKDLASIHELELHMLDLIKDALAVSRGESGSQFETKQEFEFSSFIEKLLVPYEERARQEGLNFVLKKESQDINVSINQDLVKEVCINLVDNAIKYNKKGGTLEVVVSENEKGRAVLSISDNGLGITEEGLKKLFTPYFRDENVKNLTGTGLGLYLVKKLVDKAGGSLIVKSKLNVGTTFTATF